MSTSNSSNKVARTAERKRLRNRLVRRSLKTYVGKARSSAAVSYTHLTLPTILLV